jgi:hypothetical protein
VLRRITDEIMFELRNVSGQEYVDRYATRKTVLGAAEESRIRSTPSPEPVAAAG